MVNFVSYKNNKKLYSLELLFMFLKEYTHKLKSQNIKITKLHHEFINKDWYDKATKKYISGKMVLNNPHKYKKDYDRIKKADLRYPIVIYDKNYWIIDGRHRLAKSYMQGKKI